MALTGKLLVLNPDVSTAWNFRRDLLWQKLHQTPKGEGRQSAVKSLWHGENQLTTASLRRNPKSYGAWMHRKWMLVALGEDGSSQSADAEVEMTQAGLKLDSRNFHCWNHRRFALRVAGAHPSAEARFTEALIDDNFSNYSAWHQRAASLQPMLGTSEHRDGDGDGDADADEERSAILQSERERAAAAVFTEPRDSAAWFYHHWLEAQGMSDSAKEASIARFQDLMALESSSDPYDTRFLRVTLSRLVDDSSQRKELLTPLLDSDTPRAAMYQDLMAPRGDEQAAAPGASGLESAALPPLHEWKGALISRATDAMRAFAFARELSAQISDEAAENAAEEIVTGAALSVFQSCASLDDAVKITARKVYEFIARQKEMRESSTAS